MTTDPRLTPRWLFPTCFAALALLGPARPAHAIAYYGSLQYTPPAPPDPLDGLYVESPGVQQWVNYTVTLEWWVTNDDSSQSGYPWKYTYRFRHNGGQAGFSHVIVEAAPDFAASNMTALSGATLSSIGLQTVASGNPGMPEDLYGVRFNPPSSGMYDMTWSFFSTRAPVWGDFYGRCGGAGGINRAYNYNLSAGGVARGFLDPNGSDTLRDDIDPTGPAANGSLDYHALRPGPATAPVPVLATSPADTSTLQFGYVLVGSSGTQGLTALNSGGPGSSLTGTFPSTSGKFTPASTQAFGPLAQGASTSRSYTYTPTTRMTDTLAGVTVTSNGGNSTLTLQGTGVAPVSSVDASGRNAGYVLVGTSGTASVSVTNTGNGNLSGLGAASNLNGTAPAGQDEFALTSPAGLSLADLGSTPVTYSYTPAARGADSLLRTLNFTNGDPDGEDNQPHTADFTLQGEGVAPVNQVTKLSDAGLTRIGTSNTASVEVRNIGNGNLSGLGDPSNLQGTVSLTPPPGGEFTWAPAGVNLGDDAFQTLSYTYSPVNHGADTATVQAQFTNGSDDERNLAQLVLPTVSGEGVGPVYDSTAAPGDLIYFGHVLVGDIAVYHLIIGNISTDPNDGNTALTNLTLLLATPGGDDPGAFWLSGFSPGAVLSEGGALDVEIHFDTSTPGWRNATLTFTTDVNAPYGSSGASFTYRLRGAVLQSWSDIPEPGTLSLLGLGGLALLSRRRRARRR
ncbi:MAG TPA: choice-of-anchor D domain-containing protein [Planctomycetota bacterium]|nr:choice-of-anchor D domain-containing protein [Planctomycetota bacterium]